MTDSDVQDEIQRLEAQYLAHPESLLFARLADLVRKTGDPERALAILDDGMRTHQDYLSAHIVRARALDDLGRSTEAESEYGTVLELDEQNLVALSALAEASEARGDRQEAIAWYERLLAFDPRNESVEERLASLRGGQSPGGAPEESPGEAFAEAPLELPDESPKEAPEEAATELPAEEWGQAPEAPMEAPPSETWEESPEEPDADFEDTLAGPTPDADEFAAVGWGPDEPQEPLELEEETRAIEEEGGEESVFDRLEEEPAEGASLQATSGWPWEEGDEPGAGIAGELEPEAGELEPAAGEAGPEVEESEPELAELSSEPEEEVWEPPEAPEPEPWAEAEEELDVEAELEREVAFEPEPEADELEPEAGEAGGEVEESEPEVEELSPEPEAEVWEPPEAPEPEPWAEAEEELDVEAEPEPEGDLPTETLASLYATQGLYREAVSIYEELVRRRPHDEALVERLRAAREELEGGGASAAVGPESETGRASGEEHAAEAAESAGEPGETMREHLLALLRGEAAPDASAGPEGS